MKNLFKIVLVAFMIISCGSSKKIKESKTSEKTSVKTEVIKKDSIVVDTESKIIKKDSIVSIEKTLSTESEIEIDLNDLKDNEGDFTSKIKSGNGSETTITKRGSKVKIKTKTAGSEKINSETKTTTTNESKKETNITEENDNTSIETEKVEAEKIKVVRGWPWWVYLLIPLIVIGLIYFFRKKIVGALIEWFPALKTIKIFSKIIGLI